MTVRPVASEPYDFVFAGGGLAGLSLARRIVRGPFPNARILLLDKEPKRKNDRTWCYWSKEPGDFDSLAVRTWDRMRFEYPGRSLEIPLGAYRYRMIRGADFYRRLTDELAGHPGVDWVYGEIRSVEDGREYAEVSLPDRRYRGRWVFNSLIRPGDVPADSRRNIFLLQHFLGWEVKTDRDVFDPGAFTMFDFRTPQSGAMRFFYILPASPRRALVEYTLFSRNKLAEDEYIEALKTYLRDVWKVEHYEVEAEESGVIPMTDYRFPRRLGRRILAVGTRGGRVKPSTGYAFRRIQADTARIVRSLERHGDPFHIPPDPPMHRRFDSTMLRIMRSEGEAVGGIFFDMFRKNPLDRVLAFLDERIGPAETLRLLATLPAGKFGLAFLGWERRGGSPAAVSRTGR